MSADSNQYSLKQICYIWTFVHNEGGTVVEWYTLQQESPWFRSGLVSCSHSLQEHEIASKTCIKREGWLVGR